MRQRAILSPSISSYSPSLSSLNPPCTSPPLIPIHWSHLSYLNSLPLLACPMIPPPYPTSPESPSHAALPRVALAPTKLKPNKVNSIPFNPHFSYHAFSAPTSPTPSLCLGVGACVSAFHPTSFPLPWARWLERRYPCLLTWPDPWEDLPRHPPALSPEETSTKPGSD